MSRIYRSMLHCALGVFSCIALMDGRIAKADADRLGIDDLEKKIVESRRGIWSGEFEMDVETKNLQNHPHRPRAIYHTWFSKEGQVRQELAFDGKLQVSIFNQSDAFHFRLALPDPLEIPGPLQRALVLKVPISRAKPGGPPFFICHPSQIMLASGSFELLVVRDALDSSIGSLNRKDIQMRPTTWNGLSAITVSYTHPTFGHSSEYDVVPDRGYNIVRWRLHGTRHTKSGTEETFDDSNSCTLREIAPSIWFPETLQFTHKLNEKLKVEQSVTIKVNSVNQQIGDGVFTLRTGEVTDPIITSEGPYAPESFETSPATKPAK